MADQSKIGMEFPPCSIVVEKNKIAEFVAAILQKDDISAIPPLYRDENAAREAGYPNIPAPPTFSTIFVNRASGGFSAIANQLGINLQKLLHSEDEYEYFAPICAGDTITRKIKVVDMYERGKKEKKGWYAEVTVLEMELSNQRGELVIRTRATLVEKS